MARKTKAELQIERDNAAREQAEREALAYPTFLMSTLAAASSIGNYKLTVDGSKFIIQSLDLSRGEYYETSLSYDRDSQEQLEELNCQLEFIIAAREAEKRKRLARDAALNKLTKEERELLCERRATLCGLLGL